MESVERLFKEALFQQLLLNRNPYITSETLVKRLLKDLSQMAGLPVQAWPSFERFQGELLDLYEKKAFSVDEQATVERVLSKDSPQASELVKFANCWFRRDPLTVRRWFAVDGTLGDHPKHYVHDAFALSFEAYNEAVRTLYREVGTFERVAEEVRTLSPRYLELAGETRRAAEEERSRRQNSKRKRPLPQQLQET